LDFPWVCYRLADYVQDNRSVRLHALFTLTSIKEKPVLSRLASRADNTGKKPAVWLAGKP